MQTHDHEPGIREVAHPPLALVSNPMAGLIFVLLTSREPDLVLARRASGSDTGTGGEPDQQHRHDEQADRCARDAQHQKRPHEERPIETRTGERESEHLEEPDHHGKADRGRHNLTSCTHHWPVGAQVDDIDDDAGHGRG